MGGLLGQVLVRPLTRRPLPASYERVELPAHVLTVNRRPVGSVFAPFRFLDVFALFALRRFVSVVPIPVAVGLLLPLLGVLLVLYAHLRVLLFFYVLLDVLLHQQLELGLDGLHIHGLLLLLLLEVV